ncbi:MAG: tetratricopeptide repeat protein [Ignavibacteria bacterium]|nr:tetratricopeptide repeat protein [Ignavibacteria bacterium]
MSLRITTDTSAHRYLPILFIIWIVFANVPLIAQTIIQTSAQADSLRRVIAIAKHDTTRIYAMNALVYYFFYHNNYFDSALVMGHSALEIAKRSNFRVGMANAMNNIGEVLARQREYMKGLDYIFQSLRISEDIHYKSGIAASQRLIGFVYLNTAKYSEALDYLFQALRLNEELGNKLEAAKTFNNIGSVHSLMGKHSQALEYLFKALRIYEEMRYSFAAIITLQSIGFHYGNLGEYAKAIEYQLKIIRIAEEEGETNILAGCLDQIGKNYNRMGEYKLAQPYLFRALNLAGEQVFILNHIAASFRGQGKYDSALVFALRALAVADSFHIPVHTKQALEELSIISDSLGRHKEALMYYKRYVAVKDSLVNLENLNKVAQLREAYEAEKREQQIALLSKDKDLLTKEKALQESELERRSIDLARSRAEQELQHKSILLLSNEKDLRELTVSRQEAELSAAHARDEQNKQALALAQSERDLQRAELQRRNVIQWSLAGFLVLVAISTVWLWWLNRQKLRANRKILKQQQVLEEQAIEIEAANKELQSTNLELDEANRMKTQLLSMAAHDLKNPLGVIIGYSDIILFDTPEDSDTGKYVHDIQSAAYRMNKLISDLLDSAAMEMGNITLELDEVLLPVLVSTIAARYEYNAAQKGQQILMETVDDIAILADVARLEQVFDNLVSNAVKYSPHGKTIRLRAKKINTIARFEVQDEGPGMSEEDKKKLFGFFQRLSAEPTGGESSNGVGLAIVKKIVDLHKGRIWAESELGKGTTFIVELPISRQILS